jgi:hypothetical protein
MFVVNSWHDCLVIKDEGFWVEQPVGGGSVVAHFSAYDPHLGCEEGGDLELFLVADNREAALDRARGFGILYPVLKSKSKDFWVTDEDVEAVLSSKAGAVWRRTVDRDERPGQYRNIKDWPGTFAARRG